MTEHETCKGCKWNKYPLCEGTIVGDGEFMNIEKLRPTFRCGVKDLAEVKDYTIIKKSALELRIEELEAKIIELEKN